MPRFFFWSPPARVAWIETCKDHQKGTYIIGSPPARVAWIETLIVLLVGTNAAWIETWKKKIIIVSSEVATREGGVDRNRPILLAVEALRRVATREGGVDRNIYWILKNCGGMGRHPRGWRG